MKEKKIKKNEDRHAKIKKKVIKIEKECPPTFFGTSIISKLLLKVSVSLKKSKCRFQVEIKIITLFLNQKSQFCHFHQFFQFCQPSICEKYLWITIANLHTTLK